MAYLLRRYTGLLLTDGEADKIEDDTYLFDLDVEVEAHDLLDYDMGMD